MSDIGLRQVRFEAYESVAGWQIRVWMTAHDDEGNIAEPIILRAQLELPLLADSLDQAWVTLVAGCHLLEEAGSVGRVSGMGPRSAN